MLSLIEKIQFKILFVNRQFFTFFYSVTDVIKKELVHKATYVRRGPPPVTTRFGDIISLASGWLEKNRKGEYQFVEMDHQLCKQNCTNEEATHRNVSAFWLVEKIRHRDAERGHRYELRLTVFPLKKMMRSETGKRDANQNHSQTKARSFLIRDIDYPKFFADTVQTTAKSNRIERRFFDIGPSYDDYRIPFTLNSNYQSHGFAGKPFTMALNTGEYIPGDEKPQKNHIQTTYPVATSNQLAGRLPAVAKLIPNGLSSGAYAPTANGVTATHLHHHYYLNKNQVPLTKVSAIDKENIYGDGPTFKPSLPYSGNFLPQLQLIRGNNEQQQLVSPPLSNLEQPYNIHESHQAKPSQGPPLNLPGGHQLYHQPVLPYALPSPQPSPPQSNHVEDQPQQQQMFHPLPPYVFYGPTSNSGQYLEVVPQNQQYGNIFSSFIDVDPRYLNRPPSILAGNGPAQPHPQSNGQFNANLQYENSRYSEPDPIFHAEHLQPNAESTAIGYEPSGFDVNAYGHDDMATQSAIDQPVQNQKPFDNYNDVTTSYSTTKQNEQSVYSSTENNGHPSPSRPSYPVYRSTENNRHPYSSPSYPDSINAQLPPPEHDDDLTVPYVDSSVLTQELATTVPPSIASATQTAQNEEERSTTTKIAENRTASSAKSKRGRNRANFGAKQTTEKPVLKWMPKRIRQPTTQVVTASSISSTTTRNDTDEEDKSRQDVTMLTSMSPQPPAATVTTQSATITEPTASDTTTVTSTTERVYTVTPVNAFTDMESQTSISTSISIEVGTQKAVNAADATVTQTIDDNENALLPTIRPTLFQLFAPSSNVEMIRGHLERIPTNSSDLRLFKASEKKEKTTGTVDDRIAKSIVNHAKNL